MNDFKNILLAWFSSTTSIFAAIEYRELVTIVSAIVLPVLFFAIGKTVDVLVQVYLNRRSNLNADRADAADKDGSERGRKPDR